MALSIEVQKKAEGMKEKKKVCSSREVFELEEVQEIKSAVQEHLLFIGLDIRNNIKNISLIGIGTSSSICIDSKYIIRTALITASDKVILVHNHPSEELTPSKEDKYLTNVTNKLLETFNIQFLDHIIVSENNYISMEEIKAINREYEDSRINLKDKALLVEENNRLRNKIYELTSKLNQQEDEFE